MKFRAWSVIVLGAFGWAGCGDAEVEDLGEAEDVEEAASELVRTITLPGYKANVNVPSGWWHDTNIDMVTNRYQVKFQCTSGAISPWSGHPGLSCAGNGTWWNQSLVPGCPFGSLVGKVGPSGVRFCIGSNFDDIRPNAAGRLYIAFNDGVNFQDNFGSWNVRTTVSLNANNVAMPFNGSTNKNGLAHPSSHARFGEITDWSTDLFAPAGTEVKFLVSSGITGTVVWKGASCGSAGMTLFIDLKGADGTRRGRVLYGHLDLENVNLNEGTHVTHGMVLGKTKQWPLSWGCYEVSKPDDVHIHFELGTDIASMGANNEACWQGEWGTTLLPGTLLGQFGQTGFGTKQACP